MSVSKDLLNRALYTIRFLSADAVQAANSGHPGMPMGAASMAYALWMKQLRHNPANPSWPDRDRFILSAGHGSMLLYSLLHLTGYNLSLDDIKEFRQWESKTPGHPECCRTPGVEVTTGPLGQGVSNAVGMAIAEKHLAAVFNMPNHDIIDHYTYAIVSDGDLMEGISYEATSIAGHLGLGKLIFLYDDNRISIDGSTDLTFSDDHKGRFESLGWHFQDVKDGDDIEAITKAIIAAKKDPRPSLIDCHTHIGLGLPTLQDSAESHGAPPGDEELDAAKEKAGWPVQPRFLIPDDVKEHFRESVTRGKNWEAEWVERMEAYAKDHPDLAKELKRRIAGELPDGWETHLPKYDADSKGVATRNPSGDVINALASILPELMGGSADLTPSNKTWIKGSVSFQRDNPEGRNIHFGVREHAMGGIVNGLAAHGGIMPYAATFMMFSDYMRPAVRISALSGHSSIWLFTHDSIGLGEDGPTHQPIEHLASLRAIPELVVIRPNDANEVVEAWKAAILRRDGPTLISMTRQKVPIIDRSKFTSADELHKGAYVLADLGDNDPDIILMATGSEVHLITEAGQKLADEGVAVRLVSFPSWELFKKQSSEYRDSVLPPSVRKRLAVEAGRSLGWHQWVGDQGDIISIDEFGVSAPSDVAFRGFGFTTENVLERARKLLE
ncbi:MAG: transketolase 2, thiamin-binding [Candidatus Thorarchaeota archaeon]|nr:MAG: transketolase 2, thiamin-binding [Candidatus Thorarchaeota archaeon]